MSLMGISTMQHGVFRSIIFTLLIGASHHRGLVLVCRLLMGDDWHPSATRVRRYLKSIFRNLSASLFFFFFYWSDQNKVPSSLRVTEIYLK